MIRLIYVLIFLVSLKVRAGFDGGADVTLGITDNANLEDSNQDGDGFTKLKGKLRYKQELWASALTMGFNNYFTQNANDLFFWKLSAIRNLPLQEKSTLVFEGSIFSNQYINGSPATSDVNFSNYGIGVDTSHELILKENLDFVYGLGIQYKIFPDFQGRTDTEVFLHGDLTYEFKDGSDAGVFSELGLNDSSLNDYDKNYFDLGIIGQKTINPKWSLTGSAYSLWSRYLDFAMAHADQVSDSGTDNFIATEFFVKLITQF